MTAPTTTARHDKRGHPTMTATTTEAPPKVHYRTLVGNLTRDPELRFSAKGTPWATSGLAVNRRKRLDDGTYEELPTEFYELVAFGDTAEHLTEALAKGDRVIAFGRVETDEWTTRDGELRTTIKLVCDEVGPSLRFATVEVHRTRREGPAEPRREDYDDAPF